jgi:CMP-N,N'-diacetyllegionaminic acid synthase
LSFEVLAIIPARGGSKGLPGKNLRLLGGIPLIGHTIRCATLIPEVTRAIVSTDDPEIAAVAKDLGGDVPFLRPQELARDDTPMAAVVRHALEHAEREDQKLYDAVILMEPTSPCRDPSVLGRAIRQLHSGDPLDEAADGVIAVSEPVFNPLWVGVRVGPEGALERLFPEAAGITRRQDVAPFLRINGNFYVWRSEFVRRLQTSWFDEGTFRGFVIPESQAFSIDDDYEFRLIEALIGAGMNHLPGDAMVDGDGPADL